MSKFIVIDTETTWYDEVMSIGAVVADSDTMSLVETKYYIIDPEFSVEVCTLMFSDIQKRASHSFVSVQRL